MRISFVPRSVQLYALYSDIENGYITKEQVRDKPLFSAAMNSLFDAVVQKGVDDVDRGK